jgi:hypothetical protein
MLTTDHHLAIQPPRPAWRDEYLRDVIALQKYADEVRDWQRSSPQRSLPTKLDSEA